MKTKRYLKIKRSRKSKTKRIKGGTKQDVLTFVRMNGMELEKHKEFQSDEQVCIAAVSQTGLALKFVSEEFKRDSYIVTIAVRQNVKALEFASEELKNDRNFIHKIVKLNGLALEFSEIFKNDQEIVLDAVRQNGLALQFVSDELKKNERISIAAISKNGLALQFVSEEFKRDDYIVTIAVKQNGLALQFVSEEFKRHILIVTAALVQTSKAFQFVSETLKRDRKFIQKAVKINGLVLEFVAEFKHNPEIVLDAVNQNGMALQFVPEELKSANVVVKAIFKNAMALQFATEELKHDKNIVIIAVERNGMALQFVPEELKSDKEIMLKIISSNGMALQFASVELKHDKNICLVALHQTKQAIMFIPDELKLDKDIQLYLLNIGLPAHLTRGQTVGFTDQTDQGTCGRHVFSKVIIKNIFEVFYPLPMTKEDNDSYTASMCNEYLVTGTKPNDISGLLPGDCSVNGYIKILLFLHLYHVYRVHIHTLHGKPEGFLSCLQATSIYSYMYNPPDIPTITPEQHTKLVDVLDVIKERTVNIKLVTFNIYGFDPETMFQIIKSVTDAKLYIMLGLEDTQTKDTHSGHFVLVTGTNGRKILFKNSWGVEEIYETSLNDPIRLDKYTWNVYTNCVFVIPVMKKNKTDENTTGNLQELDETLARFKVIS